MDVTIADIEKYLEDVKEAISVGKYRVEMNENRQDNRDLVMDYIVDEEKKKANTIKSYCYGFFRD